ncbi:unnamed protein product [Schistosoma mattheei]|uniref:thioredoxin-dependent peroxiredoxin n=1 Tax=Schistosoma mattheei TaxID=31246 RepID=A0A183P894_9TREM|nr:unnamed protein product [Schistosoma mattheei]
MSIRYLYGMPFYDNIALQTLKLNCLGLFIIDGKGILRQITVNDRPVGRSVDETIRLLDAFQFVEKHGEVCPANWKAGKKTIKPDPNASKEFFASSTENIPVH